MDAGHDERDAVPVGDLHYRVPAAAGRLPALRHLLAEWARRIGLPLEDQDGLVLAAYEAMANSVEHAYPDHIQGVLDLYARQDTELGRAVVTVSDYGTWKPPVLDSGPRGRGLTLIRGLTDTATITPSANGTTVTMFWPLPARTAPEATGTI